MEQHEYSLFYDTGCCDMVSRYAAIKSIGKRASKELSGPVTLGGVGNAQITSSHWTYQTKLPIFNGNDSVLSGLYLDQVTVEFSKYYLKGQLEADVRRGYISNGKDLKYFPKLPVFVGGYTDFIIGVKYLGFYPEKVFQLPSGIAIYKSWFRNADGTRSVIGGPHRVFNEIETSHQVNVRSFLTEAFQVRVSSESWCINVAWEVQEGSFKWCSGRYISIQQCWWSKNNTKFVSQKSENVWWYWEHW